MKIRLFNIENPVKVFKVIADLEIYLTGFFIKNKIDLSAKVISKVISDSLVNPLISLLRAPAGNLPLNAGNPYKHWVCKGFSLSWQRDLNPQPADYKSAALPIELCQQIF